MSRFAMLDMLDDDTNTIQNPKPKPSLNKSKAVKNSVKKVNGGKTVLDPVIVKKNEEAQWDEWQKLDAMHIQDNYETDLQQALLQSRMQHAADVQKKNTVKKTESKKDKKDKKKQNQKKTLSLDEFNHADEKELKPARKKEDSEGEEVYVATLTAPRVKHQTIKKKEEHFFEEIDDGVEKILTQEKIKEAYTKKYREGTQASTKHEKEISLKNAEIKLLRATKVKLEESLAKVKDRNQMLCQIVQKGEMDTDITEQLIDTQRTCQELTETVTALQTELEKERSHSHALKVELEKYQAHAAAKIEPEKSHKSERHKGKGHK